VGSLERSSSMAIWRFVCTKVNRFLTWFI
jgi:hypothetical protein